MDLSTLSLSDLQAAIAAKKAELSAAVTAGLETTEQIDAAEALAADLDAHEAEVAARTEAETALAARKEALAQRFAAEEAEAEVQETEEPAAEEDVVVEEPAAEVEAAMTPEEKKAMEDKAAADEADKKKAAAATKSVAELAARTNHPAPTNSRSRGSNMLTITAAANNPKFTAATQMDGIKDIAAALSAQTQSFQPPQGDGQTEQLIKFPVANISLGFAPELTIDQRSDSMAVLAHAVDESRLSSDKGEGSLVAAGGWCAPSETMYDLCEAETLDGMVSLPEVNIARGGINFTKGPQFADFYGATGPGFKQTEAQAIAGTTKTCVQVACPPFTEIRMDAIGVCIKVPILTESAYPELVERFARGTLVAHAHQVNRDVILRMVAASNPSRTIALTGSTVDDALEGLELVTNQKRQQYRLGFADTLEVVVPFWVKAMYRADLSRRQGIMVEQVTDAAIEAHFAARGLNVQWVYDWQDIDETAEVYPTTYRVLVYKAGTFVKGTSDVISISAVYDAASLAVNTYTGMFVESGLLVANMCWDAENILLPVCNAGRRGALNLTCA